MRKTHKKQAFFYILAPIFLMVAAFSWPTLAAQEVVFDDEEQALHFKTDQGTWVLLDGMPFGGRYFWHRARQVLYIEHDALGEGLHSFPIYKLSAPEARAIQTGVKGEWGDKTTKEWELTYQRKTCMNVQASNPLGVETGLNMSDILNIRLVLTHLFMPHLQTECMSLRMNKTIGRIMGLPLQTFSSDGVGKVIAINPLDRFPLPDIRQTQPLTIAGKLKLLETLVPQALLKSMAQQNAHLSAQSRYQAVKALVAQLAEQN